MYNVSSAKSQNNSPKTPGGISKSLLTPCRRVGLSRKWKKGGVSPFISPLSSNNNTVEDNTNNTNEINSIIRDKNEDVAKPNRKRSRTLLAAINESDNKVPREESPERKPENVTLTPKDGQNETSVTIHNEISSPVTHLSKSKRKSFKNKNSSITLLDNDLESPKVQKPKKVKSHNRNKDFDIKKVDDIELKTDLVECKDIACINTSKNTEINSIPELQSLEPSQSKIHKTKDDNSAKQTKTKSPNDLSKECIVVIQNNLFKNSHRHITENKTPNNDNKTSQTLFDSDDEPLININKEKHSMDNDFVEKKLKIRKITDKKETPITSSQKNIKTKSIVKRLNITEISDDEDFECNTKKTILIRKHYDKVTKPAKAKSTGSITQKDIDTLKLRIESKKKQLLAKSMTEDTKELRDLIKRWQKGCQDALLELMDLIKTKCPDRSNMDHSEILKTLKIPPNLVGYDAENDCFVTPDDESVIMDSINA